MRPFLQTTALAILFARTSLADPSAGLLECPTPEFTTSTLPLASSTASSVVVSPASTDPTSPPSSDAFSTSSTATSSAISGYSVTRTSVNPKLTYTITTFAPSTQDGTVCGRTTNGGRVQAHCVQPGFTTTSYTSSTPPGLDCAPYGLVVNTQLGMCVIPSAVTVTATFLPSKADCELRGLVFNSILNICDGPTFTTRSSPAPTGVPFVCISLGLAFDPLFNRCVQPATTSSEESNPTQSTLSSDPNRCLASGLVYDPASNGCTPPGIPGASLTTLSRSTITSP